VIFRKDTAAAADIELHLRECSADFSPPLESRVDLSAYAGKLRTAATTCEAWYEQDLVGLIAYYRNDDTGVAFITSVSTSAHFRRSGLARALLTQALLDVDGAGYSRTELEVDTRNVAALSLYRSVGFAEVEATGGTAGMARLSRAKQSAARGTARSE
jgi:ribosomal protein S18 acetylase RimI-like enzyme